MDMGGKCWRLLLVVLWVLGEINADDIFLREKERGDRTAANKDDVRMLQDDVTSLQCGHTCSKLDWCLSFFYDQLRHQCQFLDKRLIANRTQPAPKKEFWGLGGCPESKGFLPVPGTPYCLLLLTDVRVTHDEAKMLCPLHLSQLLSLDTMDKFLAVRNFLMDPKFDQVLTGSNRLDGRRTPGSSNYAFELTNGQPFPFGPGSPAWNQNQPNNFGGNQDCLAFADPLNHTQRLLLHDGVCESQLPCICEKVQSCD
ncbi:uncharacterized protein [Littorina saxatilis]|uniref:C-type lectin domain-containing protein n=1 Tax=Littorina saxatilis TaxID=31220 RepID=A0AAN9AKB3_9CAEN